MVLTPNKIKQMNMEQVDKELEYISNQYFYFGYYSNENNKYIISTYILLLKRKLKLLENKKAIGKKGWDYHKEIAEKNGIDKNKFEKMFNKIDKEINKVKQELERLENDA